MSRPLSEFCGRHWEGGFFLHLPLVSDLARALQRQDFKGYTMLCLGKRPTDAARQAEWTGERSLEEGKRRPPRVRIFP